ncbi:MAG: phytanoyl-CoA dioxygenase family protein [Deltaproteobacteria bacterium]|nr:phytanoyl-CoA dioxygenase family protein [Deltaproteobacteria bacterium]
MDPDFARDGYLVARGVVPAADVAAFHEVFTMFIPDVPYPRGPDGVVRELTGVARAYEPLMRIAIDRRSGALVARALGAARVQLLQDSMLYKPAHEGGTVEWHQDRTYIGYLEPASVATLRIALLPEDEGNGCMRVVPGSHRRITAIGRAARSCCACSTRRARSYRRSYRPGPRRTSRPMPADT